MDIFYKLKKNTVQLKKETRNLFKNSKSDNLCYSLLYETQFVKIK